MVEIQVGDAVLIDEGLIERTGGLYSQCAKVFGVRPKNNPSEGNHIQVSTRLGLNHRNWIDDRWVKRVIPWRGSYVVEPFSEDMPPMMLLDRSRGLHQDIEKIKRQIWEILPLVTAESQEFEAKQKLLSVYRHLVKAQEEVKWLD